MILPPKSGSKSLTTKQMELPPKHVPMKLVLKKPLVKHEIKYSIEGKIMKSLEPYTTKQMKSPPKHVPMQPLVKHEVKFATNGKIMKNSSLLQAFINGCKEPINFQMRQIIIQAPQPIGYSSDE